MEDELQIPYEVLQGMDVVMKENPRKCMLSIGKKFHLKWLNNRTRHLNNALVSEGFQHSLKPTLQGVALCLDYSVSKQVTVFQFLQEKFKDLEISSDSFDKRKSDIESYLKGHKVRATHRCTKQKFKILELLTPQKAHDISFYIHNPNGPQPSTEKRLLDYFWEKYPNAHIQHTDIPCLSLENSKKKPMYVPMDLCVMVEDRKKNLVVPPQERKGKIIEMLKSEVGPTGGKISRNFGIDVAREMTQVKGRVKEPPKLNLRSPPRNKVSAIIQIPVDNYRRHWNLNDKCVVEGSSLNNWAVLDFSSHAQTNDFLEKLVARCKKLGLSMKPHLFVEPASMDSLKNVTLVTSLLETVQSKALEEYREHLQLILCVMTSKHYGYKYIKWISESKIGVVTHCCLLNLEKEGQNQHLANLGMKINAKLGGSNVELFHKFPKFDKDADPVMLIGADVNHPRPLDSSSPSIAAVDASMNWPAANKYVPRIRLQKNRKEKIVDFADICLQLIEYYKQENGVRPKKLVIFCDGVSEDQFDMVLEKELKVLEEKLRENGKFTITLIVAQKRHQTHLFLKTSSDGDRNEKIGNIRPGTVVDTTIVHPREFDFCFCSHYGSIGTSKPTHYWVLKDDHGFSPEELQKFIYDLCFTFARCCNPVSVVPPVYYADLVAYRGRLHYDAQSEKASSSSATTSSSTSASLSENEIPLHTKIENTMYFI